MCLFNSTPEHMAHWWIKTGWFTFWICHWMNGVNGGHQSDLNESNHLERAAKRPNGPTAQRDTTKGCMCAFQKMSSFSSDWSPQTQSIQWAFQNNLAQILIYLLRHKASASANALGRHCSKKGKQNRHYFMFICAPQSFRGTHCLLIQKLLLIQKSSLHQTHTHKTHHSGRYNWKTFVTQDLNSHPA